MRKILLLTVFWVAYYLPVFSQAGCQSQNSRLLTGTTFSNLSLKNKVTTPDLVISYDTNWVFNHSRNNKKIICPGMTDKNSKSAQDPMAMFQKPPTIDNMPCMVPQGYFPMPVAEPDSTVRYSLLIKKY